MAWKVLGSVATLFLMVLTLAACRSGPTPTPTQAAPAATSTRPAVPTAAVATPTATAAATATATPTPTAVTQRTVLPPVPTATATRGPTATPTPTREIIVLPTAAPTATPTRTPIPDPAKTIDTLSLVRVRTSDGEAPGFLITPSNSVVTISRIALTNFASVRFRDNTSTEASRKASDGISDLAEYLVSAQIRAAIPLGTVKDVKAGDQVVIATLTETGAVELLTTKVAEVAKNERGLDVLRLDLAAPLDPKLDGSPVVSTATGKVVGVANSTLGIGQNKKFAIAIDHLPSLKTTP